VSADPAPPLTIADASVGGTRTTVRCLDGLVAAVGPDVEAEPGDEVVAAAGAPLVPALVNGHTHAAMTLFRGYGDDLPLMRWLREKVWPVEARLEADDVYWGTRLACVEMVRSGTARLWDMYWHPAASARAVSDAGLEATIGAPLIDADGDAAALRRVALESIERLGGFGPAIRPSLAPHAIYTVSTGSLRWIADLAAERELEVQIHLSETEREVADCLRENGVRPARYLDDLGLLGERTVIAHGVWLDEDELALIAERGATVVTNPVANLKLAVGGVFPYPAARAAGVEVGLGTDGAGSNNSLDLFADVKFLALVQKHAAVDAAAIDAGEAWEIACGARSRLLGGSSRIEPGVRADLLLLRPNAPELGLGDETAGLVYAASGAVVDTTIAGGRVLMRGGAVEGADDVLARARERAARLGIG
jgi:5-methylthioadenosine/S-adenosylhomocysteine deaminase